MVIQKIVTRCPGALGIVSASGTEDPGSNLARVSFLREIIAKQNIDRYIMQLFFFYGDQ
jgi:hypothetical protein